MEIVGGAVVGDTAVVVADAGSGTIRFFGLDGILRREVGGGGQGPGEFGRLGRLLTFHSDSILAQDLGRARVSVFSAEGSLVDEYALDPAGGNPLGTALGVFDDGALLLDEVTIPRTAGPWRTERTRDRVRKYARDGTWLGDLGGFPGMEWVIAETGAVRQDGSAVVGRMPRPFGRFTSYAVGGGSLFVGDNERYQIMRYDRDGRLVEIFRREHEPVAVTADDAEEYYRSRLERIDDPALKTARESAYRRHPPPPSTFPAFGGELPARTLRVDDCGYLWVRDVRSDRTRGDPWTVFAADGAWLGTVVLPAALDPLHIGQSFVLGARTDRLGVPVVELLKLLGRMACDHDAAHARQRR